MDHASTTVPRRSRPASSLRIATLFSIAITCFSAAPASGQSKVDVAAVESQIVDALRSGPDDLRAALIRLVATFRCDAAYPAVRAIVADADAPLPLRRLAIQALYVTPDARSADTLLSVMGTIDDDLRRDAAFAVRRYPTPAVTAALQAMMERDPVVENRFHAATLLAHNRAENLSEAAAALVDEFGGITAGRDVLLAQCVDLFTDPAHIEVLRVLLASDVPFVRSRAAHAIARLGGGGDLPSERKSLVDVVAEEVVYREQNEAALARAATFEWEVTAWESMLADVTSRRLVLCGEVHSLAGPLRDFQRKLLQQFVGTEPKTAILGFEPSVERAQKPVIDCATELGVRSVSMEHDWERLTHLRGPGSRDLQCAAKVRQLLADAKSRLFVIRGESHVIPNGYLCRRIADVAADPAIVLTLPGKWHVPLALVLDHLTTDVALRPKGVDDVYLVVLGGACGHERTSHKLLAAWLRAATGKSR